MSKADEIKTYKCSHEGCNYETTKEGYLTQHVAKAHKTIKKVEKVSTNKCPDCGQSDFRLLSPNNPQEKNWIQKGYTKLCKECKEVL